MPSGACRECPGPQEELKESLSQMKRSLSLVCMLASTLGASALAQGTAQTPADTPSAPGVTAPAPAGPAKIAVVQFEGVVAQTNEGQRALAQISAKFQPKQQQITQQNNEVDTLKKDLQASGDKLSETERQSRQRIIDEKEKSLQRNVEDARNDFGGEMNQSMQAVAQKVAQVMTDYAQKNGFTIVLDAGQQQTPILWASESTNISEAVLQAYNAKSGVPPQPGASAVPKTGGTTTRTPAGRTPATPRTPH